jgi:hypothetical protein
MDEIVEIAGSVQHGERRVATILSVRLLEDRTGKRVLRASYLTGRGDFFHQTWHWPAGELQGAVLLEIEATCAGLVGQSLVGYEGTVEGLGPR